MKINRILPVAVCGALLFASCDDDKMDWHTPEGHTPISSIDEIPLSTDEAMANYKFIKEYMAEYMPGVTIGLGLGADKFLEDEQYQKVAANNFQQFVTGNAMKFGSVCKSSGKLDFTKIDDFIDKAKELNPDVKIFGHNLLWHTQQPQVYLKSLIAPSWVEDGGGDSKVNNINANSGFDNGTTGYTGLWGKYTYAVEEEDGNKVIHFTMTNETAKNYDSQMFFSTDELIEGETYAYSFKCKSDVGITVQFMGQNADFSGFYGESYTTSAEWKTFEGEYTYTGEPAGITKVGFQFGGTPGSNVYFDDFQFGTPKKDAMNNIVTNSGFDNGTTGYTGLWGKYNYAVEEEDGNNVIHFTMTDETAKNYDSQMFWSTDELIEGTTYAYSFRSKSDLGITVQFMGQNAGFSGFYGESYTTTADWKTFEGEYTYTGEPAGITKVGFQFGGTPGSNVYFDDFKFGVKNEISKKKLISKSGVYELKPSDEKQTALLTAMETWITDMVSHCKEKGNVTEWDVLNEAIGDDSKIRGVDGGFMSDDGQPTESETDGLNLNWASDHFYWGYFLGKDYAVKAFQFARAAAGDDAKLYINDYNLETSESKLEALSNYVKYIDETNGSAMVDGIGTQMHIMSFNPDDTKNDAAKEGIKNMFTKLASTGKLVRISELDVAFTYTHDDETKVNPSAEQLQAQADTYKFVIEQYKAIIPTDQQGGICIWTLTDADDEHEYWLKGDKPNLFNADYSRKPAYKGVCDGIAGKDLSAEFNGSQWSN